MRYDNIFNLFDRMFTGMDPFQIFNNFEPSRQIKELSAGNFPPTNIEINAEKQYCIDIALAGIEETDITLTTDGRYIKLKVDVKVAETAFIIQRGIKNIQFVENSYFIPKQFQIEKLVAKYKNGLLSIKIPASEEIKKIEEKQIKFVTE